MRALVLALSVTITMGCAHNQESVRVKTSREHRDVRSAVDGAIVFVGESNAPASPIPRPAIGSMPDYDRFSNANGDITDVHAAWAMVQNPQQVEVLYADAIRGDQRATWVCLQMEAFFRDIGSGVATRMDGLDCRLLPALCRPDWSFLGFLSREKPGGIRLREMIQEGFRSRAAEVAIEDRVVVGMLNLLMAGAITSGAASRMAIGERARPRQALPAVPAEATTATVRTEITKLYRAVSEAELDQVLRTGRFRAGPNSLGGKWFAESAADAAKWGERLNDPGNFRVIEVELPRSVADKMLRRPRLDAIGPARYGELGQLDSAVIREVK